MRRPTRPTTTRTIGAGLAAAALLAAGALPARADGTETVTFSVATGTLSIDSQASRDLGAATSLLAGTTASGTLGNVVVTDVRNATLGWVASASSTDLTRTGGGGTVAKANATMTAVGSLVSSAGLAPVGGFTGAAASMAGSGGAIARALALGSNTATFNPSMTVVVPVDTPPGNYGGTVTFTVL